MSTDKQRLVETQRQLRIAKRALEIIADDRAVSSRIEAEAALDEMFRAGPKQQLQGLVGHERRTR